VSSLPGVKGITNRIRLRPTGHAINPEAIKNEIEAAILRRVEMSARGIQIRMDDSRVILEGRVRSWIEASEAEDVVWEIPGILAIDNRLEIAE
jgi:osmotically-inducible protein OsmY